MRVLLACEESQEVCREFRRLGHEACELRNRERGRITDGKVVDA